MTGVQTCALPIWVRRLYADEGERATARERWARGEFAPYAMSIDDDGCWFHHAARVDVAALLAESEAHWRRCGAWLEANLTPEAALARARWVLDCRGLAAACDPRRDFIGHIGGDDFILLLQSEDWRGRLDRALGLFAEQSPRLFDEADRERGLLLGESRSGERLSYPLTTLSMGVVVVDPERYSRHLQVSAAAAESKKQAKRMGGNALFVERRKPLDATEEANKDQSH